MPFNVDRFISFNMSVFVQNKPSVTIVVTPYDGMHRANVLLGDQEKVPRRIYRQLREQKLNLNIH